MKRWCPVIIFILCWFFASVSLTGQELPEDLLAAAKLAEIEEGLETAIKPVLTEYSNTLEKMVLDTDPLLADSVSSLQKRIMEILDLLDSFVYVEAGTFTMGSPPRESKREDNESQHTVSITKGFYIGKFEVTQGEYQSVMGSNPSDTSRGIGESYPVNMVSWYDAVKFCNALSRRDGLEPVYRITGDNVTCDWSKNGYRLPTEAEWEYAARGGHISSEDYVYSGSNSSNSVAWHWENAGKATHPVGQKKPNELGIFDMSGNVNEWCWDWYSAYPSGNVSDPAGPSTGSKRVYRGGWWGRNPELSRLAYRGSNDLPGGRHIGFRVVRLP